MKQTMRFKSVLIMADRTGALSFDIANAHDHVLNGGPGDFLMNRSWIASFFISLMAIIPLSALIYGIITIGLNVDINQILGWFIISCVLAFLMLLAMVGTPASVRRIKWELVIKERGAGNWKIIDDSAWENFTRMIRLVEERKKREKEELEKQKVKQPSWPAR
ncbi:MAG: hypothetical protein EHM32_00845 [Spirochaetales bacterium]|nr:MAG: hypothetical protein EHM32_00845 [Spirochaetales bacterium]